MPTPSRQSRSLTSSTALHVRLEKDLKRRLTNGEWAASQQMPTEDALASEYSVSRVTVRTALKLLEAQGLIRTKRGMGTFVTVLGSQLQAGLQELRSTSDTIRAQGHEPTVHCRTAQLRTASQEFASRMSFGEDALVVYLEREIRVGDEVVAFSYEEVRADIVKVSVDPTQFSRSLFELLEHTAGIKHGHALTDIHAVYDETIGWGSRRPSKPLYLNLVQSHFAQDGSPTLLSHNYFVEGAFNFSLMRVVP